MPQNGRTLRVGYTQSGGRLNNNAQVIPLFPLETVLFPHTMLPLHIFEPRYREMVLYCLETDSPFGIVLIREGREVGGEAEPYEVGTLARIGRLRRLEDGRFHLIALGEERFRIQKLIRGEKPYLQAEITPWRDHPPHDWDEQDQLAQEVSELFMEFLQSALTPLGVTASEITLPEDPVALSFAVAGTLQTNLEFKQYLLELQDTMERLRLLRIILAYDPTETEIKHFDPAEWSEYLSKN